MSLSRRALLFGSTALFSGAQLLGGRASAHTVVDRDRSRKRAFEVIENQWIPLSDGCRLASRIWLPEGAEASPVPVVLEYLPYRKRDLTRVDDSQWAAAFVPYGFAFVRVDIRGTGDSDGILSDEYLPQEQSDALEVIAWLAKQRWSSGAVGMRGYSWGGFNSLQVAAKAPPALKAIITQCASDNRYTDDSHYVGGSVTFDKLNWGAEFKTVLAAPPDPRIVGDRWREMWRSRLESSGPVLARWLSHQRYDAFWQQGSVANDYGRIKCPVYVVDGQVDSYRNFLPRLLANLKVPRKGLLGPWGHGYPHNTDPGPRLDWAGEEARWWTRWLMGDDNGIMSEPVLQAYMEYRTASEVWPAETPGRWIAEREWPSTAIESRMLHLNANGLDPAPRKETVLRVQSNEILGVTRREWFLSNFSSDLPVDQTPDDQHSLTFDSQPLSDDLEILGSPIATIVVSSDQPVAKVAVRINEVTPDGKSWSVTYGILNLTHRESDENPTPLEPGRRYEIRVACYFAAHRFKKGSKLRVALSESLWPMVWPSPQPVQLDVTAGASRLLFPVRPREASPHTLPIASLKRGAENEPDDSHHYSMTHSGPDAVGKVVLRKSIHEPPVTLDTGATVTQRSDSYWSIQRGDPNSSKWTAQSTTRIKRDGWDTTLRGTVELTSTTENFVVRESIHAWEGDRTVFTRGWEHTIRRDLM